MAQFYNVVQKQNTTKLNVYVYPII